MMEKQNAREEFLSIYQTYIHREGSDKLLDYLQDEKYSDFFTAPASARYHGAYAGGLCEHSLNVYHCLADYMARPRVRELYKFPAYTDENIAVAALLHDLCKIHLYKTSFRNVKNAQGRWEEKPYYDYDEEFPFGHGEKSVYMIQGFMKLQRAEAIAIRWHMGFSGPEDSRTVGEALAKYPLAFALATADMEASYFLE